MTPITHAPEKLAVTADEAARLLSISRSQFWKMNSSGKIPAPVYLSERLPRWLLEELRRWLAAGRPDRQAWERQKAQTN